MKKNKTKRILFSANLDSFFTKFLIPQLKWFRDNGYEIHIATKLKDKEIPYVDKKINVEFARSFNLKQNIESFKTMKKLFKEEHYDIVSCHTPFGGAITRLAFKAMRVKNTKMVYMAHGFHFYKGQNKLKYMLYYFAEKFLAKYTDELITINLDDYEIARKKFKTKVSYVPGVGLNTEKFNFKMTKTEKKELRASLGIKDKDFVMIYPAELLARKRQIWLIETIKDLLYEHNNFHLLLPGNDSLNGECQKLVNNLNLEKQIHFLGFRNDIPKLMKISDLAVTSSMQEGLPVNVMEAIYCGLPVVATACRGNKDLISNNENGYIVDIDDREKFVECILKIYNMDSTELNKIKKIDNQIIGQYLIENVLDKIINVCVSEK